MNNKWIIAGVAIIALAIGAGGTWALIGTRDQGTLPIVRSPQLDRLFNDDFFSSSADPFEEMERMRKEMRQLMGDPTAFDRQFGDWFDDRFSNFGDSQIEQVDEGESIAWRIDTGEQSLSEASVDVKDGYVIINAELKREDENRIAQRTIRQQFPVPANVNPATARVQQEDDDLIIRFDKTG